jgi:hypothetical protein
MSAITCQQGGDTDKERERESLSVKFANNCSSCKHVSERKSKNCVCGETGKGREKNVHVLSILQAGEWKNKQTNFLFYPHTWSVEK